MQPLGLGFNDGFERTKKRVPSFTPLVFTRTIFSKGNLCEVPFGRHLRHLKSEYFPTLWINRQRDAQRFTLGVLGCFKIIKLHVTEWIQAQVVGPRLMLQASLFGEKAKLTNDCLAIHLQKDGRPALRNSRSK